MIRLEGYASLFGVADGVGDVVRRGAFRASLARRPATPLFVRHDPRLRAGVWRPVGEDARGLFVHGSIDPGAPGAALARRLLDRGVDGLSIGFRTRASRALPGGGRELIELDLLEISLVDQPMLGPARLSRIGGLAAAA